MMSNLDEQGIFLKLKDALFNFLTMNGKQIGLDKESISLQTNLIEDLGIDSLELMDLMAVVDKKFSIQTELSEIVEKKKIVEIVSLINKKLSR